MAEKYKRLGRKHMMDIAKVVRNTTLSLNNRVIVGRALANYLESQEPFFDRPVFMQIVQGTTVDTKTNYCSDVEDK